MSSRLTSNVGEPPRESHAVARTASPGGRQTVRACASAGWMVRPSRFDRRPVHQSVRLGTHDHRSQGHALARLPRSRGGLRRARMAVTLMAGASVLETRTSSAGASVGAWASMVGSLTLFRDGGSLACAASARARGSRLSQRAAQSTFSAVGLRPKQLRCVDESAMASDAPRPLPVRRACEVA